MKQASPESLAEAWIAEHRGDAAWHARARIARLALYGDAEGAELWARVLAVIERGAPIPTSRRAPLMRWMLRQGPAQ